MSRHGGPQHTESKTSSTHAVESRPLGEDKGDGNKQQEKMENHYDNGDYDYDEDFDDYDYHDWGYDWSLNQKSSGGGGGGRKQKTTKRQNQRGGGGASNNVYSSRHVRLQTAIKSNK